MRQYRTHTPMHERSPELRPLRALFVRTVADARHGLQQGIRIRSSKHARRQAAAGPTAQAAFQSPPMPCNGVDRRMDPTLRRADSALRLRSLMRTQRRILRCASPGVPCAQRLICKRIRPHLFRTSSSDVLNRIARRGRSVGGREAAPLATSDWTNEPSLPCIWSADRFDDRDDVYRWRGCETGWSSSRLSALRTMSRRIRHADLARQHGIG
jgi:hypothetical protein